MADLIAANVLSLHLTDDPDHRVQAGMADELIGIDRIELITLLEHGIVELNRVRLGLLQDGDKKLFH